MRGPGDPNDPGNPGDPFAHRRRFSFNRGASLRSLAAPAIGPVSHNLALYAPVLGVDAFDSGGYRQELNRQLLHPLGLHMGIEIVPAFEDGFVLRVFDCRAQPAGVVFDAPESDAGDDGRAWQARRIAAEWNHRAAVRRWICGWVQQPVGNGTPEG